MEGSGAIEGSISSEEETIESPSSFRPIEVVELTLLDIRIKLVQLDAGDKAIVIEQLIYNSNSTLVLAMVFQFTKADDFNRQDIVSREISLIFLPIARYG